MRDNDEWPKSHVRKLWFTFRDGFTYSQIGNRIGRTRDAVAGKVSRLRRRNPERWTRNRIWKTRACSPRSRIAITLPALECGITIEGSDEMFKVDVPKLPLLQLRDKQCRWPIGEVGQNGFRFCKAKTPDGCSYCARHMQIAHNVPQPRRDKMAQRA